MKSFSHLKTFLQNVVALCVSIIFATQHAYIDKLMIRLVYKYIIMKSYIRIKMTIQINIKNLYGRTFYVHSLHKQEFKKNTIFSDIEI